MTVGGMGFIPERLLMMMMMMMIMMMIGDQNLVSKLVNCLKQNTLGGQLFFWNLLSACNILKNILCNMLKLYANPQVAVRSLIRVSHVCACLRGPRCSVLMFVDDVGILLFFVVCGLDTVYS